MNEIGSIVAIVIVVIVILFLLIIIAKAFLIVPQGTEYVIQRLGKYNTTADSGLHIIIPFIDSVAAKVSIKEHVADFPPQPVITKDNVTMNVDTVLYFQVVDSFSFKYKVENPLSAIENLTATTLRNVIGDLTLDESLTSRDVVNNKLRIVLDEATDPWGIKINRVELKNITPPKDVTDAMEKQSKAEREKRAAILEADGLKQSSILEAEGLKQAAILRAEGVKQSAILEAKGEAEAIVLVNKATAEGLNAIKSVSVTEEVVQLRSIDALEKLGDGRATKIFLPSEMAGVARIMTAFGELTDKVKDEEE